MLISDVATFGKAIRKRRRELGYTQKTVSQFTGCSVPFISALENGKETAEIGRALRIAQTLGLDMTLSRRDGGQL